MHSATASDVECESSEVQVTVVGTGNAEASGEVTGSGAQLSGEQAQAHVLQLRGTVRAEGSVPPAPACNGEDESTEIQVGGDV